MLCSVKRSAAGTQSIYLITANRLHGFMMWFFLSPNCNILKSEKSFYKSTSVLTNTHKRLIWHTDTVMQFSKCLFIHQSLAIVSMATPTMIHPFSFVSVPRFLHAFRHRLSQYSYSDKSPRQQVPLRKEIAAAL